MIDLSWNIFKGIVKLPLWTTVMLVLFIPCSFYDVGSNSNKGYNFMGSWLDWVMGF